MITAVVGAGGKTTLIQKLIKDSYKMAKTMLRDNREALDKISDFLYERETITGKEFMEQFREITGIEADPEEEKKDEDSSETGAVIDVTIDNATESFNETESTGEVTEANDFREV